MVVGRVFHLVRWRIFECVLMDTGTGLVLAAGTLTFGNEWYQTGKINWRVPIATLLAAGAVGGVANAAPKGGVALGFMVLIGAVVTPFKGKSPAEEVASIVSGSNKILRPGTKQKAKAK
jgi:hypothetical protein